MTVLLFGIIVRVPGNAISFVYIIHIEFGDNANGRKSELVTVEVSPVIAG